MSQTTTSADMAQSTLLGDVYSSVLNIFLSQDDFRIWMQKPFTVGDKVVSTNGYSLAAFDKDKIQQEYESSEKTKGIYPVEYNCCKEIPIQQFKDAFSKVPMVPDFDEIKENKKCKECEGLGEVEWEYDGDVKTYTMDADCPACDGAGSCEQTIEKPNGKTVYDYSKFITLSDSHFNIQRLEDLVKVAELLKEENVTLVYKGGNNIHLFKVRDVEVLLMPVHVSTLDNETVCANIA